MDFSKADSFRLMPTIKSKDIEWINWYKAMKKEIGRDDATTVFLGLWDKRGNWDANTRTLRTTLDADGISIDENVFNQIADIGGGVGDFFGNIIKAGEYTGLAVTGILVLGFGIFVFNIARSSDKIVTATLKH